MSRSSEDDRSGHDIVGFHVRSPRLEFQDEFGHSHPTNRRSPTLFNTRILRTHLFPQIASRSAGRSFSFNPLALLTCLREAFSLAGSI